MTIYTDISEAPLDTYTTPDVIDTPDHEKPKMTRAEVVAESAHLYSVTPTHTSYILPFERPIKEGTRGKDVVGAKRAIWAAMGLAVPKNATQLFGPTAVKELRAFQHKVGLRPDGVLGKETLVKLAPYFDAFAFLLYVGYPPTVGPREAKQRLFSAYMLWGYNNRDQIAYLQYRPMTHMADLKFLPISEDCSTWYTKGAKFANFSDPNGSGYNGFGYTGTIAAHGTRVANLSVAQVGDACLYGPAPGYEHVAGYVGGGRVVSLGSSPGPLLLVADYRSITMIRRFV